MRLAVAAGADGADDGAVGEDAADARGAVEARVGKQFADHERPSLFRPKILGDGRCGSQDTGANDDGNAQQHGRLRFRREDQVSKIS